MEREIEEIEEIEGIGEMEEIEEMEEMEGEEEQFIPRRGVLLCHGNVHKMTQVPEPYKDEWVTWITINNDPQTDPDIVGSFRDINTLFDAGVGLYDVVISMYCPVFSMTSTSIKSMITAMRFGRLLLKHKGEFLLRGLMRHLTYLTLIKSKSGSKSRANIPKSFDRKVSRFSYDVANGLYPDVSKELERYCLLADYSWYEIYVEPDGTYNGAVLFGV